MNNFDFVLKQTGLLKLSAAGILSGIGRSLLGGAGKAALTGAAETAGKAALTGAAETAASRAGLTGAQALRNSFYGKPLLTAHRLFRPFLRTAQQGLNAAGKNINYGVRQGINDLRYLATGSRKPVLGLAEARAAKELASKGFNSSLGNMTPTAKGLLTLGLGIPAYKTFENFAIKPTTDLFTSGIKSVFTNKGTATGAPQNPAAAPMVPNAQPAAGMIAGPAPTQPAQVPNAPIYAGPAPVYNRTNTDNPYEPNVQFGPNSSNQLKPLNPNTSIFSTQPQQYQGNFANGENGAAPVTYAGNTTYL